MQAAIKTNLPQHEQIAFTLKSNIEPEETKDYRTIFVFVPAATRFYKFISKSILPFTGHKMSVSEQLDFYKETLPNHSDANYFQEPHTNPRNCEWTIMTL